jgi:translocation and assembly module TamB
MPRGQRLLLWSVLAVLLLPVLLLLIVLTAANTTAGRDLIERATAELTHGNVRLRGLGGQFPSALTLQRLELRDPDGLWLAIDDIRLQWSPYALLSDRADVSVLTAGHVNMPRAPAYPDDHKPSRTHHWPQLRVSRLEVARADLGAALTGTPVSFSLQGSGVWTSLEQAALQLEAQRLDGVPSTYRIDARFDSRRLQGRLDVREDADGPLAHLARVPNIGALDVHLSLDGPREAVRTQLDLHAGALETHVEGTLNARTGASDLGITLESPPLSPRPGIAWQRLHLRGRWHGPLRAPQTQAELQVAGFVLPAVQLPTLTATMSGQGGTLTLDAQAEGLTLSGRAAALLARSPLSAHATVHLDQTGVPIELSASHALATATGRWRGTGADGDASLSATINDLKPFSAMAALELDGHATLEAQLHVGEKESQLKLSSQLAIDGGRAPLAVLLGPQASFSGEARIAAGAVDIARAQLDAPRAQAGLHGRVGGDGLDTDWQLMVSDLAALSPRLAGHASAQGTLRGAAPRLALTADADGDVGISGAQSGALRLRINARDLPERPEGSIQLLGTLDDAPVVFEASAVGSEGGAIEARIEQAHWRSLRASGDVHIPAGGSAPTGALALDVPQLQDLAHLLDEPLQGNASARVIFDGTAPGGRAQLHVEAHDAGVPGQQLSELRLSGDIDSVTTSPQLSLQLVSRAQIRDVPSDLHARLDGPLEAVALRLQVATQGDESTQSRLQASAIANIQQRELRVDALQLRYRGEDAHLLSPVTVSFGEGVALDQLRLGVGATVMQVQGRITPSLELTASLHDITSDLLHPWFPNARADGQIDVDADLGGTLAEPTGTVHVAGRGLRAHSGSVRGLPAGNFTIEAQLQRTVAQIKLQADVGDRLALHLEGQAPLTRTAPIALKAGGNFDLLLLNPILEAGGQRLRGAAQLDAQVSGTLADPQANGTLEFRNGDVQDFSRGLHLSDVSGRILADGAQVRLQNLLAHAGPGTISAEGTLGLGDTMPLSVKFEAHNARPLASDLVTVNADLNLTVSGPLRQRLDAVGTLHINRADLNIPNALPPSVAVLDVRRPGQQVEPPRESTFTMGLDLKVDAPRAVFVQGRGLDAELGGSLHVGGTAQDPAIGGGFDMRKGTMNLAGSTLTFTSGRLSFNGTGVRRKIDPTLDFTATNISGGVTYTLHVGGYADAPEITLSSTPEQPQDQILARLLFGADPTQLSTLQIAQIAAALATMSGVGGGLSPLTALQRKLRLDRLAISGSTSTGSVPTAAGTTAQGTSTSASIEAGRYVSSRVFVGAKQFTTGTTQAEVQVDLTRSLKIQTTLATGGGSVQGETPQNDPGSSIGLSYQFEY